MFHSLWEDRKFYLWSSFFTFSYSSLLNTQYTNLLQKHWASSLQWEKREREQRSELQYRQHHLILSLISHCIINFWTVTDFAVFFTLRRHCRINKCHQHLRFLQVHSRKCRFEQEWRRWAQIEEDSVYRSVHQPLSLWVHLMTLARLNCD